MRVAAIVALVVGLAACGGSTTNSPTGRGSAPPSNSTGPMTPTVAAATPRTPAPDVSASAPSSGGSRVFNVSLSAELFAEGLPPLVLLTHAGDGSGLLYALGQTGVVSVLSADGSAQQVPFLDIDDRVRTGGEQGLLGIAFHPDYESNGRFFVNYTANDGASITSEFTRAATSGQGMALADPASERVLLTIEDPFSNHNGGMLAFGPDGYLYLSMGDGGSGGDPMGNGQALTTLLGKMLRIDVNSGEPYAIPPDNPFADGSGLPEIWSYGLRNPWRFSFDRETGDMFIGDVGQGQMEEIDAEPAGAGGRNYGWSVMEGDICFRTNPCDQSGLTLPVAVNDRSNGECAITGGYVYRGATYAPDLTGAYVFSDFCTGTLWAFDAARSLATGVADVAELGNTDIGPSSFGEDEVGELYLVNLSGEIYRLVASPV